MSTHANERLVRVMRLALRVARRCMASYGSRKSRHDFTQPQLAACLVLKAATRNDYRGVCELLRLSAPLRDAIGLDATPHFTTLQKFAARPGVREALEAMIGQVLREAGLEDAAVETAADSTGMQMGVASEYYRTRRVAAGRARRYVKLSVMLVCGALLPAAIVADFGPTVDMVQMPALMRQTRERTRPTLLLADKGYDAEWVHTVCREEWGAMSVIPVRRQAGCRVRSKYRKTLARGVPAVYGKRWQIESFFSGLKRTTLSTLASRQPRTLLVEAVAKVLAYAIRRPCPVHAVDLVYTAAGRLPHECW